jgi:hypothetical protein
VNIYTIRRIWAAIALVLIIIGTVVAVQRVSDLLDESFTCLTEQKVIVKSGDVISTIAEEQVVNNNCSGYQSLNSYLVNLYGTDLQPGDIIHIPLKG